MPINILMPALSPTMEKGNLAKWLKKEGDKVKSGDVIAEIETDKATMEVEAVDEGTIAKILVPEGTQDVPVNDIIAVLAGDGEDVKSAGASAGAAKPAAEAAPAKADATPKPASPAPAAGLRQLCQTGRGADASGGIARSAGRLGFASEWSCAHVFIAAGETSGQGSRHRYRPHHRHRPAWPRGRA